MLIAYQSPLNGEFTKFLEKGVSFLQRKALNAKFFMVVESAAAYKWAFVQETVAAVAVAAVKYHPVAEVIQESVSLVVPPRVNPYEFIPEIQINIDVVRQVTTCFFY